MFVDGVGKTHNMQCMHVISLCIATSKYINNWERTPIYFIFSFQGGRIEANNTSVRESKFGLPLVEETKERMIDLFRK